MQAPAIPEPISQKPPKNPTRMRILPLALLSAFGILQFLAPSANAAVIFQDPPIAVTPGLTVADGSTITMNAAVSVDSGRAEYRWFKNGLPLSNGSGISGATTERLVIKPAKKTDSGDYSVQVSEVAFGGGALIPIMSSSVTLTVNLRPLITAHPTARTIEQDDALNLSVVINPDSEPTLIYEWQLNNVPIDSVANPSAATANFVIPARDPLNPVTTPGTQLANAGVYRVKVTNNSGISVFSKTAVIKVNSSAVILEPLPTEYYIASKATGKLTVKAAGAPKINYQWEIIGEPVLTRGATAASISIKGDSSADGKVYRVTVSNSRNNATHPAPTSQSTIRVINKLTAPIITAKLGATTFDKGSAVFDAGTAPELTVEASTDNTGTLLYQWQKDGKNIVNTAEMTGVNSRILVFSSIKWTDRGVYRCIVRNQVGVITSKTFKVEVNSAPVILSHPVPSLVGITGGAASATVAAGGTGKLSYQWHNSAGPVDKQTRNKLSLTKLQKTLPTGEDYFCNVENAFTATLGVGGNPTPSNVCNLVVYDPAKITTHPTAPPNGVRFEQTLTLNVGVTGDEPMVFEWFFGNQRLVNGPRGSATISGADSRELVITQMQPGLQGTYYCNVRNANISGTSRYLVNLKSKTTRVNVIMPATVVGAPLISPSATVLEDSKVTMSIAAAGTPPLRYQWQKSANGTDGWTNIAGQTKTTYTINSVQVATDSAFYRCVVDNALNEPAPSPGAELVVELIPPSEVTDFFPKIARGREKVRVFGTFMRQVKNVRIGSASASFVIENDDSLLITVPDSAPLAAIPEIDRLIRLENKNHATFSSVGFTRTTGYGNDLRENATILTGSQATSNGDNTNFVSDVGGVYVGDNSTAWFWWKAPSTGNYRIRAACSFDSSLVLWEGVPSSGLLTLRQAVSFIGVRTETMVSSLIKDRDYLIVVAGNSFGAFRTQGTFRVDLQSTTINVTDDDGDRLNSEISHSGQQELVIPGEAETTEDVVMDALADYDSVVGPTVKTSMNVTLQSESGEASEDGFGWTLYGTDDAALAGVWFSVADGKVYVTDSSGSYTGLSHQIRVNSPHHLEIWVNRATGTWSTTLDGVEIVAETGLPPGSVFKEISPVWKPSPDSTQRATMKVTDFSISAD